MNLFSASWVTFINFDCKKYGVFNDYLIILWHEFQDAIRRYTHGILHTVHIYQIKNQAGQPRVLGRFLKLFGWQRRKEAKIFHVTSYLDAKTGFRFCAF